MTARRTYLIRNTETGVERLVRAANAASARNHVARDTLDVRVATQDQLIALLTAEAPITVEDAGREADDAEAA